jgi:hypothetical protein
VRNIFEITYVSSKIGPLKSNLDGPYSILDGVKKP